MCTATVILFARAPVPGRVKTRLAASIGAEAAADLHSCFVKDMMDKLETLRPRAELELHTDTDTDAWNGRGVARFVQANGDLGRRMFEALRCGLEAGRAPVMILGSDAPTLPLAHLEALLGSAADVALGPTEDGGYYAISCRRVHAGMFEGVEWSGPRALEQTCAAIRACGLSVELGPAWYDIDTPEDLARLAAAPHLPVHTAAWCKVNVS